MQSVMSRTREDLYVIKGNPLSRNIAGDPRYAAFLRKMRLPE
jgi:hypothetical protein